ncbi:MAG TPA: PfkB family carbohydrate kinase [Terriglobales bacterium]|nr:PfkB family carbohydrate kinase [Terriglobales bacterium]
MKSAALATTKISRQLRALRGRRVAVIGDAILDEFLWGDATRISPEAPVPVVLLERRSHSLGGAANVAANIVALGGEALLFAPVGADDAGDRLRALAGDAGVGTGWLVPQPDRPTTVKHRVFARNKHLLRFDQEVTAPLAATATRQLLAALAALPRLDAVIVSDYAKGCVTPALVSGISRLCQARRIPWCVDPKLVTLRYRGATVMKPNLVELERMAGAPASDLPSLRLAAARVLRQQRCLHLLVTRGQHGMALFGPNNSETLIDGAGQLVADVTGAGDTVSAVLGLGLAAGLAVSESAALANLAGGFVVSVPGTAVVRPENILAQL